MDDITIDGMGEMEFRRSIEEMLRRGEADGAASKLRGLLEPYAGESGILPARFLTVSADEISFAGWDELSERLGKYDRPELQISALSVAIAHPEEVGAQPGEDGTLSPSIETSYFSDSAFPFSVAARDDLLDGYSHYGCQWQGDFESTDSTLSVEGIDDLYGAIVKLEAKLMDSEQPDTEEIRAGSLGACYLAVLIHQALRETVRQKGLPRALCVMAGRDEVYPFFDAPVMTSEEYRHDGTIETVAEGPKSYPTEDQEVDEQELEADDTGYNSLLSIGGKSMKKKPVLSLDPDEVESASRLEQLAAAEDLANRDKPKRVNVLAGLSAADATDDPAGFAETEEDEDSDIFDDPQSFRESPSQDLQGWDAEPPLPSEAPGPVESDANGWGAEPPLPTEEPLASPEFEQPEQVWQVDPVEEQEPAEETAELDAEPQSDQPTGDSDDITGDDTGWTDGSGWGEPADLSVPSDGPVEHDAPGETDGWGPAELSEPQSVDASGEPDQWPQDPVENEEFSAPAEAQDWQPADEAAELEDLVANAEAEDRPTTCEPQDAWDNVPPAGEVEWPARHEEEAAAWFPEPAEPIARVEDIVPPQVEKPSFEPQGHSLRARIVKTQEPVKTKTHRFVAFIEWLIKLIKRS
ncbi:MAG: hypothetical protein H6917_00165 [Novosphingobium sp.]|nr:hypothetical protein [Novosphingobium sp.]MCP5400781.1 hypothetical protein [Novosphingobium sp.]